MSVAHHVASTDGVVVAVHEFGGSGPPLLFCHATGFHGAVWGPVAGHLTDRYRCLALDFRGHGDSRLPAGVEVEWHGMAADVLAVVDALAGDGPVRAAGWSMGGCALTIAEQERPGTWHRAWAFEPIIFGSVPAEHGRGNRLAEGARRRREVFASREAARDNYRSKPPFSGVAPEALAAYVDHGFDDLADGTVRLKCRGETEASVFEASITDAADHLAGVAMPFTVVASGDGNPPAMVAPWVAESLPQGRLERMDDRTHFAPLEDPARVAGSIAEALA